MSARRSAATSQRCVVSDCSAASSLLTLSCSAGTAASGAARSAGLSRAASASTRARKLPSSWWSLATSSRARSPSTSRLATAARWSKPPRSASSSLATLPRRASSSSRMAPTGPEKAGSSTAGAPWRAVARRAASSPFQVAVLSACRRSMACIEVSRPPSRCSTSLILSDASAKLFSVAADSLLSLSTAATTSEKSWCSSRLRSPRCRTRPSMLAGDSGDVAANLSASRWMEARMSAASRIRASRSVSRSCTRPPLSASKARASSARASRSGRRARATRPSSSALSGPCLSICSARARISARRSSKAAFMARRVSSEACWRRASSSSSMRMRSSRSSCKKELSSPSSRARVQRSTSSASKWSVGRATCLPGELCSASSTARESSSHFPWSSRRPSPGLTSASVASRSCRRSMASPCCCSRKP
mmetsp:Transcript_92149/g.286815  ORF Transcript_92149/g.286815 Transcript_92149/m.286815 type:complete len:422 (-) Transcript_92149:371-1636(-)